MAVLSVGWWQVIGLTCTYVTYHLCFQSSFTRVLVPDKFRSSWATSAFPTQTVCTYLVYQQFSFYLTNTLRDRRLLRFVFLEYNIKGPDRDNLDEIDTAWAEYPRYMSRASSYSVEFENVNIVMIRLKSESIVLLSFSCKTSMHQTSVHVNTSH